MIKPPLNHKRATLATVILLTLILSLPLISSFKAVDAQDYYYNKNFEWDYDGHHWSWNISIPKELYDAYKSAPVSTRVRNGLEGYGFLTTTNDYYLQALTKKLNETSAQMGYGSYDEVSFVLAFVQSLPYTSDSVTSGYDEYPRFPIETLVDGGGDCEDTAILFATLTIIMNYGTVYINPPNHYAVGILGQNISGGTYWTYNNKTYYYCETTGDGFKIGQLPDEFKDKNAHIYAISESQQFTPDIQIIPPTEPYPITTPRQPDATLNPTPTNSDQPMPLALEDLLNNTTLITIIIVIIIVVGVAVAAAQKTKGNRINQSPAPSQSASQATVGGLEGNKYCMYCGSSNRPDAVFCDRCGKRIA
jgi:hypothetical protein